MAHTLTHREKESKKKNRNRQSYFGLNVGRHKRHFIYSISSNSLSIYYAINDHALLKSCIYISVSASLFMFIFYGKIITDFARWPFRHIIFSMKTNRCVFFFGRDYLFDRLVEPRKQKIHTKRHTTESHFGLQMW